MDQIILKVLNNYENIDDIKDNSNMNVFSGVSYQHIYAFTYKISDLEIAIVMGIPVNWGMKLVDIYIKDYKRIKYIPHLDIGGKLCLFDLEGVLIDKNFEGLLRQTLIRMHKTLKEGLNEGNKEDFIEEFEQYWSRLPKAKYLKSMINHEQHTKPIKYSHNKKNVKKKRNEKYIDVMKRRDSYNFACSDSEKDFYLYKDMKNIHNGVYIYIETDTFIYPPDWRESLEIYYINNLLKHESVDEEDLISGIKMSKGLLFLVFNINQPNGCINTFGVAIDRYDFDISSREIIMKLKGRLVPCHLIRCDSEYLLGRGGASNNIYDKKILVVGCGSIGGYLINDIIKMGINNVTVVDGDILKEENIYRHLLGMEYINSYKSKAILDYFNKNIPNINIISYQDNIEDVIQDESISLNEYDLIVSAVGNHNLNRWINEYVYLNKVEVPVVYLWNEVLGIGNHVAFTSFNYKGCYECFFNTSEDGVYDKSSYAERGQIFVKKMRGCGSSYLPFSSTNSTTTVIHGIEVIKQYFENRINENFLTSVRGDVYYFEQAGLKTSNRYDKQHETRQRLEGEKYHNEKCLICGDR